MEPTERGKDDSRRDVGKLEWGQSDVGKSTVVVEAAATRPVSARTARSAVRIAGQSEENEENECKFRNFGRILDCACQALEVD